MAGASLHHFRERRRHIRKVGEGLVVVINSRVFPLLDISIAGLSFQCLDYKVGDVLTLAIAETADMSKAVEGRITVISANHSVVRGRFYPTMRLMRFIVGHFSAATGVAPRYFT